jgi:hypothetical protein
VIKYSSRILLPSYNPSPGTTSVKDVTTNQEPKSVGMSSNIIIALSMEYRNFFITFDTLRMGKF